VFDAQPLLLTTIRADAEEEKPPLMTAGVLEGNKVITEFVAQAPVTRCTIAVTVAAGAMQTRNRSSRTAAHQHRIEALRIA
jgi:hypothetical protein